MLHVYFKLLKRFKQIIYLNFVLDHCAVETLIDEGLKLFLTFFYPQPKVRLELGVLCVNAEDLVSYFS